MVNSSIARDLGVALGLPASLETLRRSAIGPFDRAQDELIDPVVLARAANLIECRLEPADALRFAVGGVVACDAPNAERCAVLLEERLIGLGELRSGCLHPRAVLSRARADLERSGL